MSNPIELAREVLDEDRDPPVPMSYARTLATVVIAQHAEIEQLRAALREACELAMFTHPREFDLSARIAELRKLAGET